MSDPSVQNAADDEQVAAAEEQDRINRRQELDDLRAVMETAAGKRFVRRQLENCGVFRLSYTGDEGTVFREGQRQIGLILLNDLCEACPGQVAALMVQAKKD